MQPAPTEAPQNTTLVNGPRQNTSSFQHGLHHSSHQASGILLGGADVGEPTSPLDEGDKASIASSGTHRGRPIGGRQISSREGSQDEGSPGSRIDEYEKAHPKMRKHSEELLFQIVPMEKGKVNSVSIEDFPSEVLTHILSHLPPDTLSSMSFVSRRFRRLVTTPPAWRIAFARYFLGDESVIPLSVAAVQGKGSDVEKSQRRAFTRLSALASWRSEYILRTRLLRSLARGRPALQVSSKSGSSRQTGPSSAASVVTYSSGLLYPVSHIHATFGVGLNKRQPFFMHGAVEQGAVSTSDPSAGKIGSWGLGDFEAFQHFADLYVGEAEYGLGAGNVVGMPNVMDISQPYGKAYGEACPGGRLFYTGGNEQRGRFLPITSSANHDVGIPEVNMVGCSICSVWIAKSDSVLKATSGLFGILAGFSNGVLSAFALGVNPVQDRRYEKGEPTAKWVLCPGVPIISICIDERMSRRRMENSRIWAVVLNALGEVFYLTDCPTRPDFKGKALPADLDRLAWGTGRSVEWKLVEATRRVARPDPFGASQVDGSYSPRTSSTNQGLSPEQITGETKEVERFLVQKPKHFQKICEGWDMRRTLFADFAGDDRRGAGESIFIVSLGLDEGSAAAVRRFTRCRTKVFVDYDLETWPTIQAAEPRRSIFGGFTAPSNDASGVASPRSMPRSRNSSTDSVGTKFKEEWHLSSFSFGDLRNLQLSTVATDDSDFATLAATEDPLLGMSGGSNTSSPVGSPLGRTTPVASPADIPGHRARLMAAGTKSGIIVMWDMRAALSPAPDVVNTIEPARVIFTKSPQISSLALTALYIVHGGNDGLVQAWDPLASTSEPIRTLNSRFSDRARRRIAQAEASAQGVGNNYYAAGAIVLDPDPTALRGLISLGTRLKYWSYSSTAADAYKSRKRGQLRRRSQRGSNSASAEQRVSVTARGMLKDYIANEKLELEREKLARKKETERMSGRFGVDLLGAGASDEEILAYATMLSEEAWTSDEVKRQASEQSSVANTPHGKGSSSQLPQSMDADMAEALRLSLRESEQVSSSPRPTSDFEIPVRFAKSSKRGTPSRATRPSGYTATSQVGTSRPSQEDEDLEFALQLSLAEERSKMTSDEEFPELAKSPSPTGSNGSGKGKGKSRRS